MTPFAQELDHEDMFYTKLLKKYVIFGLQPFIWFIKHLDLFILSKACFSGTKKPCGGGDLFNMSVLYF